MNDKSNKMKVFIGSDHAAPDIKQRVIEALQKAGYEVTNMGTDNFDSCDYPDIALKVCAGVKSEPSALGILICGTGIGMSMAANKVDGIRCALCGDTFSARMTREHNDANVLALGARVTGEGLMNDIIAAFLTTPFSGELRHQKRIDKVMAIEDRG
jgi:ribose 5-phosphate isomerase B